MIKAIVRKIWELHLSHKFNMNGGSAMLVSNYYNDYKNHEAGLLATMRIHSRGFNVSDWKCMSLTKDNYKSYLTTAQYYSMHPINGSFSKWIDDKLTLKYLLAGTHLDKYMPEYYMQIDEEGKLLPLPNLKEKDIIDVTSVVDLLIDKKELAFKLIAGSIGEGFYKVEYVDNCIYVNGIVKTELEFIAFVEGLRNYIIIEYLHPHKMFEKFSPRTTNTIRYLAGRYDDGTMRMLKSYVRFGTEQSGFVENFNRGRLS